MKLTVNSIFAGNNVYPLKRSRSAEDGGKLATKGETVTLKYITLDFFSILAFAVKNIEIAHKHGIFNSSKSIKCICMYVNKGIDRTAFDVQPKKNDKNVVIHMNELPECTDYFN